MSDADGRISLRGYLSRVAVFAGFLWVIYGPWSARPVTDLAGVLLLAGGVVAGVLYHRAWLRSDRGRRWLETSAAERAVRGVVVGVAVAVVLAVAPRPPYPRYVVQFLVAFVAGAVLAKAGEVPRIRRLAGAWDRRVDDPR